MALCASVTWACSGLSATTSRSAAPSSSPAGGLVPLYRLVESVRRPAAAPSSSSARAARGYLWGLERLTAGSRASPPRLGRAGGTVIDLSPPSSAGPASVLACGPESAPVVETAAALGVESQVALENQMGCALGVCRGCVIPRRLTTVSPWPRDGNARYATVCKEGPVFLGEEVDWEAMAHAEATVAEATTAKATATSGHDGPQRPAMASELRNRPPRLRTWLESSRGVARFLRSASHQTLTCTRAGAARIAETRRDAQLDRLRERGSTPSRQLGASFRPDRGLDRRPHGRVTSSSPAARSGPGRGCDRAQPRARTCPAG
jgi:hypothetical protein